MSLDGKKCDSVSLEARAGTDAKIGSCSNELPGGASAANAVRRAPLDDTEMPFDGFPNQIFATCGFHSSCGGSELPSTPVLEMALNPGKFKQ